MGQLTHAKYAMLLSNILREEWSTWMGFKR